MKNAQEIHRKKLQEYRKSIVYALIAFTIGSCFFYHYTSSTFKEYRLTSYGLTAEGIASECKDFESSEDDNGNVHTSSYCTYTFALSDRIIEADEVDTLAVNNLVGENLPTEIKVQYLESNPEINQIATEPIDIYWVLGKIVRFIACGFFCYFFFYVYVKTALIERREIYQVRRVAGLNE